MKAFNVALKEFHHIFIYFSCNRGGATRIRPRAFNTTVRRRFQRCLWLHLVLLKSMSDKRNEDDWRGRKKIKTHLSVLFTVWVKLINDVRYLHSVRFIMSLEVKPKSLLLKFVDVLTQDLICKQSFDFPFFHPHQIFSEISDFPILSKRCPKLCFTIFFSKDEINVMNLKKGVVRFWNLKITCVRKT